MTTQAKHTPGPWQASADLETSGVPVFARNKAGALYYIATCSYIGTADPAPAQANARLIASAPALLEALQALLDAEGAMIGTEYGNELLTKALAQARTAIQSATLNQ